MEIVFGVHINLEKKKTITNLVLILILYRSILLFFRQSSKDFNLFSDSRMSTKITLKHYATEFVTPVSVEF